MIESYILVSVSVFHAVRARFRANRGSGMSGSWFSVNEERNVLGHLFTVLIKTKKRFCFKF